MIGAKNIMINIEWIIKDGAIMAVADPGLVCMNELLFSYTFRFIIKKNCLIVDVVNTWRLKVLGKMMNRFLGL